MNKPAGSMSILRFSRSEWLVARIATEEHGVETRALCQPGRQTVGHAGDQGCPWSAIRSAICFVHDHADLPRCSVSVELWYIFCHNCSAAHKRARDAVKHFSWTEAP